MIFVVWFGYDSANHHISIILNTIGILGIVIGFIVASTGSFFGALVFIGIVALIGAFSYIFILGDVIRMQPEITAG